MKKTTISILAVAIALTLFSCTGSMVGKRINPKHAAWDYVAGIPHSGAVTGNGPLDITYRIESGHTMGEYVMTGEISAAESRLNPYRIVTSESKFALLIVSSGVVTDSIPFIPRGSNLGRPLPFRIEFSSNRRIDAVAFWYEFTMEG